MSRWIYYENTNSTPVQGLLSYCPQNISIFRQERLITYPNTLIYCPQDLSQFARP